ncbi:hypothetical protein Q8F55_007489 [Vanrija albida]|uniref:Uncharacterized protein n=1 Tax=Vanrija albida TaxID=181172 RepID=A0ABR3PTY1_9TREE
MATIGRGPSPAPAAPARRSLFNITWGKKRSKTVPAPVEGGDGRRLRKVRFAEIDAGSPPPVPPPPQRSRLGRILKSETAASAPPPPPPRPPSPAASDASWTHHESYYPAYTTLLSGAHAPTPDPIAAPWLEPLVWRPAHDQAGMAAAQYPVLPSLDEFKKAGRVWDSSAADSSAADSSKYGDAGWSGYGRVEGPLVPAQSGGKGKKKKGKATEAADEEKGEDKEQEQADE